MDFSNILYLLNRVTSKNINTPDPRVVKQLKNHPLFMELQTFKKVHIDNIHIDDPIKRKMCICYFTLFYEQLDVVATDIVEHYPDYAGNANMIIFKITGSINDLRSSALSKGIPKIFLDKYTPRMETNMGILTNIITEVCQTHLYCTPKDEICAVMDVTLTVVKFCIDSAEGIINHMNGELHMALEGSVFDT